MLFSFLFFFFFFFNDTATTEIYTLSLHDALPISLAKSTQRSVFLRCDETVPFGAFAAVIDARSEEHTSELQSQSNLVCRLLLEKKKKKKDVVSRCCTSHVVHIIVVLVHTTI